MIAFEQTGLQNIRRLSAEASQACNFQSLLVVQPGTTTSSPHEDHIFLTQGRDAEEDDLFSAFDTYAMTLVCYVQPQAVRLRISYDAQVTSIWQMQRMANHFKHVLARLCTVSGLRHICA